MVTLLPWKGLNINGLRIVLDIIGMKLLLQNYDITPQHSEPHCPVLVGPPPLQTAVLGTEGVVVAIIL